MNCVDVNVLLAAAVPSHPHHDAATRFLASGAHLGIPSIVAASFLRLMANPRVATPTQPPRVALTFLDALLAKRSVSLVEPGRGHWQVFRDLVRTYDLSTQDVTDAYLAAIAIERGATWVSFDRGFARFRELSWVNPADSQ